MVRGARRITSTRSNIVTRLLFVRFSMQSCCHTHRALQCPAHYQQLRARRLPTHARPCLPAPRATNCLRSANFWLTVCFCIFLSLPPLRARGRRASPPPFLPFSPPPTHKNDPACTLYLPTLGYSSGEIHCLQMRCRPGEGFVPP